MDVAGLKPLASQHVDRLLIQLGKPSVDVRDRQLVDRPHHKAHKVLSHIGVQHANGAQCPGSARHVHPAATESIGHGTAVHRPGATRSDQRKTAGRVTALDRDVLYGMQQVLLHQADHPSSGILNRESEGLSHLGTDRVTGSIKIEIERTTSGFSRP